LPDPDKKISQPKNEPAIKSYHHEKSKSTKRISYLSLMVLIVLKIFFIAIQIYFHKEILGWNYSGGINGGTVVCRKRKADSRMSQPL
jgi:hypothetical protein